MKIFSSNIRLIGALIAPIYILGLHAESLEVGAAGTHADVCSAIAVAAPGDVIEITGPSVISGCAITTPDLVIKGINGRPNLKVEAGTGLIVAADNITIENIRFDGTRSENGGHAAIDLLSGSLTLRNVYITGSDSGVRAHGSEVRALSIERSEIIANGSNVDVGSIARFALLS